MATTDIKQNQRELLRIVPIYPAIECAERINMRDTDMRIIDDIGLTPDELNELLCEAGITEGTIQQDDMSTYTEQLTEVLRSTGTISEANNPGNTLLLFPGTGGEAVRSSLNQQFAERGFMVSGNAQRIRNSENEVIGYDIKEYVETICSVLSTMDNPQQILLMDDALNTGGTAIAIRERVEIRLKERGITFDTQPAWVIAAAIAFNQKSNEGKEFKDFKAVAGTVFCNPNNARVRFTSSVYKRVLKQRAQQKEQYKDSYINSMNYI